MCVHVYESLANFLSFLNFFSYISAKVSSIVFISFFLFLKELDIAIVKATNHVEYPPKERHVRSELINIPHYIIILNLFSNANDVLLHFHLLYLMTFVLAQVSEFLDQHSSKIVSVNQCSIFHAIKMYNVVENIKKQLPFNVKF